MELSAGSDVIQTINQGSRSALKQAFTTGFSAVTTVVIAGFLLFGLAGQGLAQQLPFQQAQSELNRNIDARDLRNNPQANSQVSQRQAINLARQRFAGSILRISLVGEGANRRYQIRMENEGKVFTVFVHIATGRVTGPG